MKYLLWLIGMIVVVVVAVFVIAFTPLGNGLVKPIIEDKIKAQTKLDSKLNIFALSMSDFEIVLELNKNNTITIKGDYSLFAQSFDVNYDVKLDELKSLKPLSGVELRKSFATNGTVKGDMAFIEIDGDSDVALSKTTYHVELTDMNPTSIIAKVNNLKLDELLDIGAQKPYASADINMDINFKNIKAHALDGDIVLKTTDGKINSKVMKNDFNVTIPQTDFKMNLDAKLKGDDIDYRYLLVSNLFKVNTSGKVIPQPLKTDIEYSVDIKELALLKPITGADVRGPFKVNGKVKGTKEKLVIDGKSNLAFSDTTFNAVLKEFAPASIKASIKNLRLARVLYMVKQPHYADGVFSLDVDISDARSGQLKGNVLTSIKEGLIDSKYMTKAYEFETQMPRTTFKMNTQTTLNGDIVDSKVDFISNLANFSIKKASLNLKDSSLKSDYMTKIHNLNKLFFATQRQMKGAIRVDGKLSKDKDLDLTMHTKVAGGKIDAKLHNDDLHADIVAMQTMDALHMLVYPEIFSSSLDAKLDYNLATKKGDFNGHLVDGKFSKNIMFALLKKYAKFDLYKETYKGDVSAKINKENILASLDLKSRKASIKTTDTKLNTKTKMIDSSITVVGNKQPVVVTLKGKTNDPKISLDVEALLKSQAGDRAKKEVGRLFKKLF